MSIDQLKSVKRDLRQTFLRQRSMIPHEAIIALSAQVCTHLAAWLSARQANKVLLYSPIKGEVDVLGLAELLPQVTFGLPVLAADNRSMRFALWHRGTPMVVNRYGIPEPNTDSGVPLLQVTERTVIVVPCLAVDEQGVRLGYGGGFYDRFLATHMRQGAVTVGVVLTEFLRPQLPHEAHDMKLAYVATQDGVKGLASR